MRLSPGIALVVVLICLPGCVRDVKNLKDFPEDKVAVEARKAAKLAEEEAMQAIKKRFEEKPPETNIFDPWVPPVEIPVEKLSRALQYLPKDKFGYTDWTAAVRKGLLSPLDSLEELSETKKVGALLPEGSREAVEAAEKYLNESAPDDIIFEINDRLMFNVRFPHKVHTYWLSCQICHPAIFVAKKGANNFTMYDIWEGRYCGRCHGKVAFQPKGYDNCRRCHSSRKKTMGVR